MHETSLITIKPFETRRRHIEKGILSEPTPFQIHRKTSIGDRRSFKLLTFIYKEHFNTVRTLTG